MTDELGKQLREELEGQESFLRPTTDIEAVVRRGTKLRWQKRIGAACVTCGTAVIIALVGFRVFVPSNSQRSDPPRPATIPSTSDEAARAATFSIRAVAEGGVLDTTGKLFDYQSVEMVGNDWRATFEPWDCSKDISEGSCQEIGDSASVTVSLNDESWTVTDAEGPLSPSQKNRLLSYEEPEVPDEHKARGWMFRTVSVARYPDTLALTGSPVWSGPIPDSQFGSVCRGAAFDANGERIFTGGSVSLPAPTSEELRSGAIIPVVIPEVSGIDAGSVSCETLKLRGWQPVGDAVLGQDDDSGEIVVDARLEWKDPAFLEIFTECSIAVLDEDGEALAERIHHLIGPDGERAGNPPFVQQLEVPFTIANPENAASASVDCSVIGDESRVEDSGS